MKRIRMGVIGCGEIAQIMHLPFLTELRDLFEVRSVWEVGNMPQATRTWFDEELTVYGSGQTVTVQFPNPYVRYAPTLVRVQEMDGTAHAERTVRASYDEAFRREWRHFHHCVTTGAAPRTDAADGLRDVAI